MRRREYGRQRGVAVVTALLLTTLAITIVASLFWQQQVQVRSIENQRLQLQKQWILRGALDWARLILREDALFSQFDTLDEPWAVPLSETRLDQYVENGRVDNASDAVLSGHIVDAQSRYNLANLSTNGNINPDEVAVFARLLSLVQLNPALAQETAQVMAASQRKKEEADNQPQPMRLTYVHDLLAVPGFTVDAVERLRELVVILPRPTKVNVNTAPAEVLAASIDNMSLADAKGIVSSRDTAVFRNLADFTQRFPGSGGERLDVKTTYFLVNGSVRMNRAGLDVQALVERESRGGKTELVWLQQN